MDRLVTGSVDAFLIWNFLKLFIPIVIRQIIQLGPSHMANKHKEGS